MYEINKVILNQYPESKVRCTESPGGEGIEIGDDCITKNGWVVPIIRLYTEGPKKPLNPIKQENTNNYKFIEI